MAGTEEKQHLQDFLFSHLSCSGSSDGLSYPSDSHTVHEYKFRYTPRARCSYPDVGKGRNKQTVHEHEPHLTKTQMQDRTTLFLRAVANLKQAEQLLPSTA